MEASNDSEYLDKNVVSGNSENNSTVHIIIPKNKSTVSESDEYII